MILEFQKKTTNVYKIWQYRYILKVNDLSLTYYMLIHLKNKIIIFAHSD